MSGSLRAHRSMTLWHLEIARLLRTHRWLILVGVYATFGILGPVSARYINEIIARFGEGIQMTAPDPRPVDGIIQFIGNASQLGLLAVAVVAASALAFDARPEVAAFLRTKVERPGRLVIPAYSITLIGATVGLVVGTAIAYALSVSLIGPLPLGAVVVGTAYGVLYLAFAIAVVAVIGSLVRGQGATILTTIAVLLAFPLIGIIDPISPWLPSSLLTAVAALAEGVPASEYLRAVLVTLILTPLLILLAMRRVERREV